MQPLPGELLEEPIALDGCPQFLIIEWRPTPGLEESTGPSPKSIKVLAETCRLAVKAFPDFIGTRNLEITPRRDEAPITICVMPAGDAHGGAGVRNLNDRKYRFHRREDSDDLWGYVSYKPLQVYIRNDVLEVSGEVNKDFKVVFAHEIFHALNWARGTYRDPRSDEMLARAFTRAVLGAQ